MLEIAELARNLRMVAKGRSAGLDRRQEHRSQRVDETAEPPLGDTAGPAHRVDAGLKQGLAGVDVADPGDHVLVQKKRLDRGHSPDRLACQIAAGEGRAKRLWTKRGQERMRKHRLARCQRHEAESPGIGINERATRGFEAQMVVRPALGRTLAESARHAEVKDQRVAAIGRDQPVFCAARDPDNGRARQPLAKIRWQGKAQVRPVGDDKGQPFADKLLPKATHDGFDFGQFGHNATVTASAGSR